MRKVILFFILSLVFSASAADKGVISISGNRLVAYESKAFKSKEGVKAPTFVFLPGIYRGQRPEDALIKTLNSQKINYVFFDFAEQVNSVVQTEADKKPDFRNITSADLAKELDAVVDHLKLENPVPVTLSYSATVTAFMSQEKYPIVIEAAPIGKDTDTLPPAIVALYETWKAWLQLNPFGEMWLRSTKEIQLSQHWGSYVAGLAVMYPQLQNPLYSERAVQGYKALTYASEDFDLRDQDFAKGPKRFFVLGEDEEKARYQIQMEAIGHYQKVTGHVKNVIVLPKAGHIVTADQPEAFVKAIQKIVSEN